MNQEIVFIDGNFKSGKGCKYHCSPTCHPEQIGPEWVYGCTNKKHPGFNEDDFCPIVNCDGDIKKCEIKKCLEK